MKRSWKITRLPAMFCRRFLATQVALTACIVGVTVTAVVMADPVIVPTLPNVFCFRITDVEQVPAIGPNAFVIEFEVLNWTDTPAGGVQIALTAGTSAGVELVGAGVDRDGRGGMLGGADVDAAGAGLTAGEGVHDTVAIHSGRGRDDTGGLLNDWNASSVTPSTAAWQGGTPIPNRDLIETARAGGNPTLLVPGTGEDAIGDSAVDGGVDPYNPVAPPAGGGRPNPDGSGNVLDGLTLTINDFKLGDTLSFNWFLLGPNGAPLGVVGQGNAYGFGTVGIVRVAPGGALPTGLFIDNTGFAQNNTLFFDSVWSVPDLQGAIIRGNGGTSPDGSAFGAEFGAGITAPFQSPADNVFDAPVNTELAPVSCIAGDANTDGAVTFADFAILQNHFNQAAGPREGDFNGDGQATFADFAILQNNFNETCPPPVLEEAGPLEPLAGELFAIEGQGFGNVPDDLCILLDDGNGRFIGLEALTTCDNKVNAVLPAFVVNQPHQLIVHQGIGARVQIPVDAEFQDDLIVPGDQWVWCGQGPQVVPGVFPGDVIPTPVPCPLGGFHSGPPSNGQLCVVIDQAWGAGTRVCIEARVHREGRQDDTRINDVEFMGSGTEFDCAVRICSIIKNAFASHPTRPLDVNCNVTPDAAGAKITLTNADGVPIIGGNIDIKIKPGAPVIGNVLVEVVAPGELIRVQGNNFPDELDGVCLLLEDVDGAQIPLPVIAANAEQIVAQVPFIPEDANGKAHKLKLGRGQGVRADVEPGFEDVFVDAKPWLWEGGNANMVVALDANLDPIPFFPIHDTGQGGQVFHSGPPVNGTLCLTIDQDWGPMTRACLSARIHKPSDNGHDLNFSNLTFRFGGSRFECAQRICDLLKRAFAKRGRKIICTVTVVGTNAKITIRCASGETLNAGYIKVQLKPAPPVITDVTVEGEVIPGALVRIIGNGFARNADDNCVVMEDENGAQIGLEVQEVVADNQIIARLGFVPEKAGGVEHFVKVGRGVGFRPVIPPDPDFGDVKVQVNPWTWAGEPADMVQWDEPIVPQHGPTELRQFTSEPPQDGTLCVTIDSDWGDGGLSVSIGARIHKPSDMGHDINFSNVLFEGSGTKFDCAVRICSLLKDAFAARGRLIACNVTADDDGNAKLNIRCLGPDQLNAGFVSITELPQPQ